MYYRLVGCSPVKVPVTNEYQLSAYSTKHYVTKPDLLLYWLLHLKLLQDIRQSKCFMLKNLFNLRHLQKMHGQVLLQTCFILLLVQSLQQTGYFYAVASSPYNAQADYRLDTQLLILRSKLFKKTQRY